MIVKIKKIEFENITARNSFILSPTSPRPCKQNKALAKVFTARDMHMELLRDAEKKK